MLHSHLNRCLHTRMIYGLEYLLVEFVGPLIFEADLEHHHDVSEALNANSDWSVSQIRSSRLLTGVEVVIDHFVQISRDHFGHAMESVEVESPTLDKTGERNRGQVAHCYLIWRGILDHLATKV